jgi:hypothetical protein
VAVAQSGLIASRLKAGLVARFEKDTGRKLEIGSLHGGLFGHLALEDVRVGLPGSAGPGPASAVRGLAFDFEIQKVVVSFSAWDLLFHPDQALQSIKKLEVFSPSLSFRHFSLPTQSVSSTDLPEIPLLPVPLVLHGGKVLLDGRLLVESLSGSVQMVSRTVRVDLRGSFPGSPASRTDLKGDWGLGGMGGRLESDLKDFPLHMAASLFPQGDALEGAAGGHLTLRQAPSQAGQWLPGLDLRADLSLACRPLKVWDGKARLVLENKAAELSKVEVVPYPGGRWRLGLKARDLSLLAAEAEAVDESRPGRSLRSGLSWKAGMLSAEKLVLENGGSRWVGRGSRRSSGAWDLALASQEFRRRASTWKQVSLLASGLGTKGQADLKALDEKGRHWRLQGGFSQQDSSLEWSRVQLSRAGKPLMEASGLWKEGDGTFRASFRNLQGLEGDLSGGPSPQGRVSWSSSATAFSSWGKAAADWRLLAEGLDLSHVQWGPVTGTAAADWAKAVVVRADLFPASSSAVHHVRLQARQAASGWSLEGLEGEGGGFSFHARGIRISRQGKAWVGHAGMALAGNGKVFQVPVDARLSGGDFTLHGATRSGEGTLSFDALKREGKAMSLKAQLRGYPLAALSGLTGLPEEWTGKVYASASGFLGSEPSLHLRWKVEDGKAGPFGFDLARGSWNLHDGWLNLADAVPGFVEKRDKFRISFDGGLPMGPAGKPRAMKIHAWMTQGDLSALAFLPGIRRIGGPAHFDFDVTGEPVSPVLDGKLTLQDGILEPDLPGVRLEHLRAVAAVESNQVRLLDFKAKMGGEGQILRTDSQGPILVLHRFRPEQMDFSLRTGRLGVRILADSSGQIYSGDVRGEIRLQGEGTQPRISGRLTLEDGVLRQADPAGAAPGQDLGILDRTLWRLELEAGENVHFRNDSADLVLATQQGPVLLNGQGPDRGLNGSVNLVSGDIDSWGGTFQVASPDPSMTSGQTPDSVPGGLTPSRIEFRYPLEPRLEVHAYQVFHQVRLRDDPAPRDRTVLLDVTGPLSSLETRLHGESMSQAQVASLLGFGRDVQGAAGLQEAWAGLATRVLGYGGRLLGRRMTGSGGMLPVDELGLEPGQGQAADLSETASSNPWAGAKVKVGKTLSKDVQVDWQHSVAEPAGDQAVNEWGVNMRMAPGVSARVSKDFGAADDARVGVEAAASFGAYKGKRPTPLPTAALAGN